MNRERSIKVRKKEVDEERMNSGKSIRLRKKERKLNGEVGKKSGMMIVK